MNLADYLSELLGLEDEVNVPGLGYFVRTRVNAYYNDAEGRFYPPYHQVKFVAQAKEDDAFAQYVADKKNISLASSKYFVEKFITKLREDASHGKYLFADLGSFHADLGQLIFKPNDRIPADPAFYGYPAIDIFSPAKPAQPEVKRAPLAPDQPVTTTPAAPATPPPPRAVHTPDYYEEEVEEKRRTNVWLIILIIIAVLGLGVFALYKFNPSAFDKVKDLFGKNTATASVVPVTAAHQAKQVKRDSVKKAEPAKDTVQKTVTTTQVAAKADSVKLPKFEAVVAETRGLTKANTEVTRLQALGHNAYIVQNARGPLMKISVGQYPTWSGADSVIKQLVKSGIVKHYHHPFDIQPN